ncbi:MAG: glucose-1-phosphate adenylyltransferase [Verrucomicrobia bacterium]|nr:glucose-1-phosphate adenylyltransferase [Verrucomicrobiota bacterium]MCF7708573.1 glucose-1-phosphate adenylyltransferase [Verrucomicrobiota bacterium]
MASAQVLYDQIRKTLAIILGGGRGTRLQPLTLNRAKPAVPLAGKYRLVDIPISNCINSSIRSIYVLTQFNSASLHRHITQTYSFDQFTNGFVDILAAEQTYKDDTWYQGTADAVRKNINHFLNNDFEYAIILSGDQLYRLDYRFLLEQHIDKGADLTVATIPVSRSDARDFGILQVDQDNRITEFVEKPKEPDLLDKVKLPPAGLAQLGKTAEQELYLASMGIYLFNKEVLFELLEKNLTDFGNHIIPQAITTHQVYAYMFEGYWEDVGSIKAFFDANIALTENLPRFNFFDMDSPIFTRPRFLPPSKINQAEIQHSIIADGTIINHASVSNSVIGIRTVIDQGARLYKTVTMGSDFYEIDSSLTENLRIGRPAIGIGKNTRIENAIIDKNARIGENCSITPANKPEELDGDLYYIREGIIVIPKGAVIPHGTVI